MKVENNVRYMYSKEESISWPFSWPFMILEAFFSSLERERGAHKAPSCTQGTTSHFLFAIQRDLKQKGSWRVKKCTHTQCISTNRWGSSATCFLRKFWLIGVQFFWQAFAQEGLLFQFRLSRASSFLPSSKKCNRMPVAKMLYWTIKPTTQTFHLEIEEILIICEWPILEC